MKRLFKIFAFAGLCVAVIGCASNANQKINSPLIGFVKHEYYIYDIRSENGDTKALTNIVKNLSMLSAGQSNSVRRVSEDGTISLGRGTAVFAIDNQLLVGRDIGNATSNDVSGSISIPIGK